MKSYKKYPLSSTRINNTQININIMNGYGKNKMKTDYQK